MARYLKEDRVYGVVGRVGENIIGHGVIEMEYQSKWSITSGRENQWQRQDRQCFPVINFIVVWWFDLQMTVRQHKSFNKNEFVLILD